MALDADLAPLDLLDRAELRARWCKLTDTPAPKVGTAMLRLALAWEIQARALGGLSRATVRTLDQLAAAKTKTSAATPGMRLVREWGGRVHVVEVDADQIVRWDGRDWRSLSEVAREITGTRWSGPAFFGLKKKAAAA